MTIRRAVAGCVLALAAAVAWAAPGGDPLEPLRAALERQDQLAAKGQFEQLVTEARQNAKAGTPEALYLLGRALGNLSVARRAEGKGDESKRLLDESQRCFEDAKDSGLVAFAPAWLGLARCARARGDVETAVTDLKQALKIAPGFRAATIDLAQVFAETRRFEDAEFVLYRHLESVPGDPEVRILLGMVKMGRERYGEAEKEFREAVRLRPDDPTARKLLGGALLNQRSFAEAAEHFDTYRRMVPKDEEIYRVLFLARMKLRDRAGALRVLDDARKELPGSDVALWAERVSVEYQKDPETFEQADEKSPRALAKRLESNDPKEQLAALRDMRGMEWEALPAAVYRLLAPAAAPADVREAAVALIGDLHDARTLTILEILLFHPREQDPDPAVRRAAARALAGLATPAVVPVLVRALDQGDEEIREAAVKGIAAVTGKYFRERLEDRTPPEKWGEERSRYDAWWRSSAGGSLARRDAATALVPIFQPIQRGRARLAVYALPAVEDADARTWRAGYDLFRSLTGQDFGAAAGEPDAAERGRITQACRDWFLRHGNEE